MVPHFSQDWEGTRSSAGVVPLFRRGLASHLRKPDGSKIKGVAQAGRLFVAGGQASKATVKIDIAGVANVSLQGNNLDPAVEDDWIDLETAINDSAIVLTERACVFYRVLVNTHGSGPVDVAIHLTE